MSRGRKPQPTALRRAHGNPGKRAYNHAEPVIDGNMPDCPAHLTLTAQNEWARLAGPLHASGILTLADRAALAAYCQCYGRWVEAEERLAATPTMLKTPSGYVQQSPWLAVANKQLELMGRYMAELGLTPASRSRIASLAPMLLAEPLTIQRIIIAPAEFTNDSSSTPRLEKDGTLVITGLDATL